MKRPLKWTVVVLVVVAVLALVALVAVPFAVDTPRMQTLIASGASRTITIAGPEAKAMVATSAAAAAMRTVASVN